MFSTQQPDKYATLAAECGALRKERAVLRMVITGERRRHGNVETILTRMTQQLERQIEDLRGRYASKRPR